MEINLRKLFYIAFIAVTVLLGGCGVTDELERRNSEISHLNQLLETQYGTRAADLNFAERQVGIYRGCTFLFNVCSTETTVAAEKLIKNGFTGSSSAWWWFAYIGKLTGIAAFLGMLLWLPWHLFVLLTRPAQTIIDEARKLISGIDEKVDDANRKRTQVLQQASAMKRDSGHIASTIKEQQKQLSATKNAASQALTQLYAAKAELEDVTRLRENFKQF